MRYLILPQNKEHYILSYQHFPPDNQSFLRMLSLHVVSLLSLCDLVFFPTREKTNCLFETTVLSTSTATFTVCESLDVLELQLLTPYLLAICIYTFMSTWIMAANL